MNIIANKCMRYWDTEQLTKENSLYKFHGDSSLLETLRELSNSNKKYVKFTFNAEDSIVICHWMAVDECELISRKLPNNWLYAGEVIEDFCENDILINRCTNMFVCASSLAFSNIYQNLIISKYVQLDQFTQYKIGILGIFNCDLEFEISDKNKLIYHTMNEASRFCDNSNTVGLQSFFDIFKIIKGFTVSVESTHGVKPG